MPDDRLPTREQIAKLERDSIQLSEVKAVRDRLGAENARLRPALGDMTDYVRLGMTWIEDSDRHAKMKRAWERGQAALGQEAI